MRRRQREESNAAGAWLTTWADMMSLLFAFFLLLFSFSTLDEGRFSTIIQAFQDYLGIYSQSEGILDSPGPAPFDYSDIGRQQLYQLFEELSEFVEREGLQGVDLQLQERGVVVRFAEQVFFDLGEATLKPEAIDALSKVAGQLKGLPNHLRVEGHTDNWPIRTARFPSNWELSVHRATNVVRYLVEEEGFDPTQLSAAGYSEYRPIRPNDTAEDRAMNRRVDIVILNIDLLDFEPN